MREYGAALLQAVASRIIDRYVREGGATGVLRVDGAADPLRLSGVDIVCSRGGQSTKIKVKADPYYGSDPRKIADHELAFYRAPVDCYAFETISHHVTRDPGWMVTSAADDLYYYFLALDQTEDEVAVLIDGPDDVFFSELSVERDDLHVLPMAALRAWFEAKGDAYTPRPVKMGDHSSWCRIIPVAEIDGAVPGVTVKGSVFSRLSHR
jgi:hypothetical protein